MRRARFLRIPHRTIDLPLPTHRLASTALRALQVDTEISPFVNRSFSIVAPPSQTSQTPTTTEPQTSESLINGVPSQNTASAKQEEKERDESKTVLQVTYKATTNRMLRVAVNAFMDTLGVVLEVMEDLDVDVLQEQLSEQG